MALARWKSLAPKARLFVSLLAGAGVCAIVLALALARDTRVPLFATPLSAPEISEVCERLAEWNVPFIAGSDNVRVEVARRNDLLMKLSLAGIPHAQLDSMSDILAKVGPLTPQVVLEAQQRDGLAGDIASGLRGIAGVADARVIIAPAQNPTYADEGAHPATASVRLSLRPGETLARETAAGIRAYVAAAVPGLVPAHVALLDDRGSTLGDDASLERGEGAALEESLQSALDLAFGTGATIVRVRANYDPRAREVRDILRQPLGNGAIATTTADEHYKSASKQYGKSTASFDRGSDVRDERIDTPGDRLERLSVAVAVDAARHLDLEKIRSLAQATLGLVSARGDVVSVEEVAFAHVSTPERPLPLAFAFGMLATLVPSLAFAAAIVVAARFAARPLGVALEAVVQRIALGRPTQAVAGFPPAHVRGALRDEPPHTAAAIISALPSATASAVLEMYSAQERAAIVRRMARTAAPAVPDYQTVLRRG